MRRKRVSEGDVLAGRNWWYTECQNVTWIQHCWLPCSRAQTCRQR